MGQGTWCSEERAYGIAILENRNMNCLGKAGVTARPRECQFEVCGHALKGSGWQGLVLSSSIDSCFSPGVQRRVWLCERWTLAGPTSVKGKCNFACCQSGSGTESSGTEAQVSVVVEM